MRFKKRPLIPPKKRSAAFIHDGNPDNIVYDEEYYRKIAKEVADEAYACFKKYLVEFSKK